MPLDGFFWGVALMPSRDFVFFSCLDVGFGVCSGMQGWFCF